MYICTCIHTCTHTYIHPPNVPRVQHSLVSTAHLAIIFHVSLSCAFLFRLYISLLHHSFISSCHSLFGLPLFVFPSISLNTTSFISLLSSILQMCPSNVCIHTYIHTYIHTQIHVSRQNPSLEAHAMTIEKKATKQNHKTQIKLV